jgi:hypothetical protein
VQYLRFTSVVFGEVYVLEARARYQAKLVSEVLKRKQLKRETAQHAKVVREKHKDFASLRRKLPSSITAKEDEELFYDKERVVKKAKQTEKSYVLCFS